MTKELGLPGTVEASAMYHAGEELRPQLPLERLALALLGDSVDVNVSSNFRPALGEEYYPDIRLDAARFSESPLTFAHLMAAAYAEDGSMIVQAKGLYRIITSEDKLDQLVFETATVSSGFMDLDQDFLPQAEEKQSDFSNEISPAIERLLKNRVENIRQTYEQLSEMAFEVVDMSKESIILIEDIDHPENLFCFTFVKDTDDKMVVWIHYLIRSIGAPVIAALSLMFLRDIKTPVESEEERGVLHLHKNLLLVGAVDGLGFSIKSVFHTLASYLEREVPDFDWEDDNSDSPLSALEL